MNSPRIQELRALCDAATPGEWQAEESVGWDVYAPPLARPVHVCALDEEGNARFIAASRTALSECLDEIERLRAEIDALTGVVHETRKVARRLIAEKREAE